VWACLGNRSDIVEHGRVSVKSAKQIRTFFTRADSTAEDMAYFRKKVC
jgi:hypothetical protein